MDPFPMLKICFVEPKSTDTGKKSRLFSFGGKALTKKSKRIGSELLGNAKREPPRLRLLAQTQKSLM